MEPITISGSSLAPSSKGDSIIQSNQDATNETKISVDYEKCQFGKNNLTGVMSSSLDETKLNSPI